MFLQCWPKVTAGVYQTPFQRKWEAVWITHMVLGREARPSTCRQVGSHPLRKMRTRAQGENQSLEVPTVRGWRKKSGQTPVLQYWAQYSEQPAKSWRKPTPFYLPWQAARGTPGAQLLPGETGAHAHTCARTHTETHTHTGTHTDTHGHRHTHTINTHIHTHSLSVNTWDKGARPLGKGRAGPGGEAPPWGPSCSPEASDLPLSRHTLPLTTAPLPRPAASLFPPTLSTLPPGQVWTPFAQVCSQLCLHPSLQETSLQARNETPPWTPVAPWSLHEQRLLNQHQIWPEQLYPAYPPPTHTLGPYPCISCLEETIFSTHLSTHFRPGSLRIVYFLNLFL